MITYVRFGLQRHSFPRIDRISETSEWHNIALGHVLRVKCYKAVPWRPRIRFVRDADERRGHTPRGSIVRNGSRATARRSICSCCRRRRRAYRDQTLYRYTIPRPRIGCATDDGCNISILLR